MGHDSGRSLRFGPACTLNTMTVGMLRMPYSVATPGLSSVFSFNCVHREQAYEAALTSTVVENRITNNRQANAETATECVLRPATGTLFRTDRLQWQLIRKRTLQM